MRGILEVLGFVGFVAATFLLTLVPGGVWAALLTVNLKTGIERPWAVPVALGLLWAAWRVAGGEWPSRGSEARRVYRRANPVPFSAFAWAMVANALSITALAGLWIALKQLVRTPGNPAPDFSAHPALIIGLVLGCAAIVGAVSEEVGLRGYLLGKFERRMPWQLAVLLVAVVAAPAHMLTQGFVWPTLLFYLAADITYGLTAYLTNSITPGIIAHAAGLFVFFTFIWPHDAARRLVSLHGADPMFWGHVAQTVVFGALAVLAFMRLAKTTAIWRLRRQVLRSGG